MRSHRVLRYEQLLRDAGNVPSLCQQQQRVVFSRREAVLLRQDRAPLRNPIDNRGFRFDRVSRCGILPSALLARLDGRIRHRQDVEHEQNDDRKRGCAEVSRVVHPCSQRGRRRKDEVRGSCECSVHGGRRHAMCASYGDAG